MLFMNHISKAFPGVQALDSVSLEVHPGEVHALLGENGAGKSTLIKVLMGIYQKDAGTILIDGKETHFSSPLDAQAAGLAAVYQDVMLSRHLSVSENFFMGRLPLRRGLVDWRAAYRQTGDFLQELGITIDPKAIVGDLTVAKQQLVAIAKVLHGGAKLIVFDEPTALLTNTETDILFSLIRALRQKGKAIIYISHRMEEIFALCDKATILKDGKFVQTDALSGYTQESLVSLMVGRTLENAFPKRHYHEAGTLRLRGSGLSRGHRVKKVDISIRSKQILGIYGLVGAGRSELAHLLFGADACEEGQIYLDEKEIHPRSPLDMIHKKVGLICEDRKHQSLAMPMDVLSNVNLVRCQKETRLGFLEGAKERSLCQHYVDVLRVKTSSASQLVCNLSGGNQQKLVIGKWLAINADILIFDEPTIGVDVGARMEIYQLMQTLLDDGKALVMISSYLPEVIALSDQILVMHEGHSMGVVDARTADEESLLRMASGIRAENTVGSA